MRIVPAFDERKDSQACFGLCVEGMSVEQFAFERGEKTLAESIVKTIAN
jgi:hypothetical protein